MLRDSGFAFERPMDLRDSPRRSADPPTPPTRRSSPPRCTQFAIDAKVEDVLRRACSDYIATVEQRVRPRRSPRATRCAFFTRLVRRRPARTSPSCRRCSKARRTIGVHRGDDAYQLIGLGTGRRRWSADRDRRRSDRPRDGALVRQSGDRSARRRARCRGARQLFALVEPRWRGQHYTTPRIMLYESVVRAVTVARTCAPRAAIARPPMRSAARSGAASCGPPSSRR